jgi:hypothetical protein
MQDAPTGTRPTRKKRGKINKPEMLSRNVEITGVSTSVVSASFSTELEE